MGNHAFHDEASERSQSLDGEETRGYVSLPKPIPEESSGS
jgi:hypothetical protein